MDFKNSLKRRRWSVRVATDNVVYYEDFDMSKIKARLEEMRKDNRNPKIIPITHLLLEIGILIPEKAGGRLGKTVKYVEVTEEARK